LTIDPVTLAHLIDDCASVRDIPLQVSVAAALLESDWLAGDTMIAANAFHEALKAFVQPAQLQKALIAVLDVHATHRARLATVLTAAAHRMGQADWLDELAEMKDDRDNPPVHA
jgi:hypothetical protein